MHLVESPILLPNQTGFASTGGATKSAHRPHMVASHYNSLDRSLIYLLHDEVAVRVLAGLSHSDLTRTASIIFNQDTYGCATIARNALALLPSPQVIEAGAAAHVQHVMWCSWRTAQRITASVPRQSWHFLGTEFLAEARGKPTVLVAPMTMPFIDVLSAIGDAFSERDVVIYGEGLSASTYDLDKYPNLTIMGEGSLKTSAAIIKTLERGGVFCTYPDFVYSGHPTITGCLFGRARNFSKAFISICSRPGVHLLPILLYRDSDTFQATIHEPVIIDAGKMVPKDIVRSLILETIRHILEDAICCKPEQWLLLGTLAAETYDMLPHQQTNLSR